MSNVIVAECVQMLKRPHLSMYLHGYIKPRDSIWFRHLSSDLLMWDPFRRNFPMSSEWQCGGSLTHERVCPRTQARLGCDYQCAPLRQRGVSWVPLVLLCSCWDMSMPLFLEGKWSKRARLKCRPKPSNGDPAASYVHEPPSLHRAHVQSQQVCLPMVLWAPYRFQLQNKSPWLGQYWLLLGLLLERQQEYNLLTSLTKNKYI